MNHWKYGVVAVLISASILAREATAPATTAPPTPTAIFEESTKAPTLIEQLAPTSTETPLPPSASFSVDVDSGNAPLTVNFGNVSDGPITSREWDLGDGTTSTDQSPNHRYTLAGTYTVQLKVTGPGGTDTSQMADLIAVSPGPPFSLEVSPSEVTLAVREGTQFTTVALDEFGNVISTTPEWVVVAGGGSIDAAGRFSADTRVGSFIYTIRAYVQTDSGELEAAGSVTVEPGPVSKVLVEPTEVTLNIGATQPFSFSALDEFGNQISDVLSSWSTPAEVGAIDANGLLTTGTKAGVFPSAIRVDVVKGTVSASGTADVGIRPDPLDIIRVEPSPAVVLIGKSVDLTARGLDEYGNEIPGVAFLWRAPPGKSISTNGKLRAASTEESVEIEVSAIYRNSERTTQVTVVVLDLPFPIGSSVPAVVAQEEAANAILGPIFTERRDDFARISLGASIHAVSSGLYGTDPCTGITARSPCTDVDVIDPLNQLRGSIENGQNFIFGRVAPQFIIIDLGEIRELDSIGAQFDWRLRDRGIDSFGVFVSLDGLEYTSLSAPVNNPNPPTFFSADSPVQARFIAYYFGRCASPNCSPEGGGSRVTEVYARGASK